MVLPRIILRHVYGTDFNASYRGVQAGWDIGRPQPVFAELANAGAFQGRVLDVGCGTGEHALLAAGLGLPAAGVDAAPAAIEMARQKAAQRNLPARFSVHDALDLGTLGEQFDTVIDSALFHVFSPEDQARYVGGLCQVVEPGGRFFMLCLRHRGSSNTTPRGVTPEEIEAAFANGWRIDEIESAALTLRINPSRAPAWRTAMTRV
jgi:cyclopropane fatty-acyl-phospholipid synthase-like methyltransferase